MKTIEELFVNEYEKQKQTIDDLKKEIDSLNEKIKYLKESIMTNMEYHQATINEIKAIGLKLVDRATYITANVWGVRDKEDAHEKFPILVDAGCIEFPGDDEDGTK